MISSKRCKNYSFNQQNDQNQNCAKLNSLLQSHGSHVFIFHKEGARGLEREWADMYGALWLHPYEKWRHNSTDFLLENSILHNLCYHFLDKSNSFCSIQLQSKRLLQLGDKWILPDCFSSSVPKPSIDVVLFLVHHFTREVGTIFFFEIYFPIGQIFEWHFHKV